MAIVNRDLRYAVNFKKVVDLLGWMRYTSEKRHHIDLNEARECSAYKCVYRLSRATCTTDEHDVLVVRLLECNVLRCRHSACFEQQSGGDRLNANDGDLVKLGKYLGLLGGEV